MFIQEPKINTKISPKNIKACYSDKQTIVFSLEYFTNEKDFNIHFYDKKGSEGIKVISELFKKLSELSQQTWEQVNYRDKRNGGSEKMAISEFNTHFANSLKHITKDESVYIVRFNGKDQRLFFKRGHQCNRVAQLLACEFKLGTAYKHD